MKKVLSFCCSGPRNRTVLPVIKAVKNHTTGKCQY